MDNFPYSFWGIEKEKLNKLANLINTVETKYEFDEDTCNDIDCEARELAEKYIKEEQYPLSNLTNIICKATIHTLNVKINEAKNNLKI